MRSEPEGAEGFFDNELKEWLKQHALGAVTAVEPSDAYGCRSRR
jgi:hypothetical protein